MTTIVYIVFLCLANNKMAEVKPILSREKILVVGDIQKWLKIARDNLEYYGCPPKNIVYSENVENALRQYQEQRFTFILTDINFDIENIEDTRGLNLIQKIRNDGYAHPIIAMSSLTGNIGQRTIDAGANLFIDKKDFVCGFDDFVEWYSKDNSR